MYVSTLIDSTIKVRKQYRKADLWERGDIIDNLYGAGFSLRDIANLLDVSLYQVRKLGSAFAEPKRPARTWADFVWGKAA